MIDLHYWTTPNGHKITMFLEETGLPYRLVPVDITKNERDCGAQPRCKRRYRLKANSASWRSGMPKTLLELRDRPLLDIGSHGRGGPKGGLRVSVSVATSCFSITRRRISRLRG